MSITKKIRKPLKTVKEDSKWKNIKSIDIKTQKVTKNTILIEETKKWKHPWYEVVDPKKKEKFIRSIKDETKINNLDPKLKWIPRKITRKK